MVPSGWRKLQISDICKLQNGNSFKPHQWDTEGLPIIRIQNLNGSDNFNYYSGEVNEKWLVFWPIYLGKRARRTEPAYLQGFC